MRTVRRATVVLIVAAMACGYAAYLLRRPYAGFGTETFVDFPKGTGALEMAGRLRKAGVIRHTWQFLLVRALRRGRALQAGEYRFYKPASTFEVFDRIARGDVFFYELVVPEGKNIFDIAAAVERLGLFSGAEFLRAARNPASIRDLDPAAPSLEGYLFPDSYRLSRHTTAERLCHLMTARFRETWKQRQTSNAVHDTVTLASLIEKEARMPEERRLISSVYHNRLKMGMKLDCDPTAIYAALIEGRYQGIIHKSDLDSAHPYNTYRHAGLPPGPIANPGKESLAAALDPAPTGYLYFVLRPDGSGAHNFSRSMAAHLVAAAQFRRANHRQEVQKEPPARVSGRKKSRPHR